MNQNEEVKEKPQWVIDILINRLDRLEHRMINLQNDVRYLLMKDGIDE